MKYHVVEEHCAGVNWARRARAPVFVVFVRPLIGSE